MKFAERLKELRLDRHLSQAQLAQKLGKNISSSAIGLWELNKRVPNLDAVILISQFFGVSIDYLAGLQDFK